MPATNVRLPMPLARLNPVYPGQMGVPGGWTETGLRLHPTGTTFYVDPNFPGASDQRDGTDPTSPLLTVAAAISKCQSYRGDVIAVSTNSAWIYAEGGQGQPTAQYTTPIREEVTVNVSGIRIVGQSFGTLGVLWNPASDGGTCINVAAMDVIIEGFVFDDGPHTGCNAIYAEWDGTTLFGENMTVRHCYFDDSIDKAIQLEYAWYCDIHDNVFQECDEHGIYVDPAGSGTAYCQIHNNWFMNCAVAMTLRGCDDSSVYQNFIYNGKAKGALAATDEGIDTTGGGENMIFDNWFSCILPAVANGDWDDLNTGSVTDAWINCHCLDGDAITTPT